MNPAEYPPRLDPLQDAAQQFDPAQFGMGVPGMPAEAGPLAIEAAPFSVEAAPAAPMFRAETGAEMVATAEALPSPDFQEHVGEAAVDGELGMVPATAEGGSSFMDTAREIVKDPDVRAAAMGIVRLVGNTAVTIADLVPGVGEVVSGAADAAKFIPGRTLDLSPDVPKWASVGSEIFEPVTGGFAPSHLVELTWQGAKDLPRIKQGFTALRDIVHARRAQTAAAPAPARANLALVA